MDPHHITSVLDVNTYLLQENQADNIKQKNIIKLGEYYYFVYALILWLENVEFLPSSDIVQDLW